MHFVARSELRVDGWARVRCTGASARGWKQPRAVAELLRMTMALLLDYELRSSAFAARIASSNGASLPA